MKKLMIMCGTGIATSTLITGKIKTWLEENNYTNDVKLYQGKVSEEISRLDDYDIILSTTIVSETVRDKVINGVPLLTGMGVEQVYNRLEEEIKK